MIRVLLQTGKKVSLEIKLDGKKPRLVQASIDRVEAGEATLVTHRIMRCQLVRIVGGQREVIDERAEKLPQTFVVPADQIVVPADLATVAA